MTPVTILSTRYVRGWPRHEIGGAVEVVDLLDALERDYATDAHFALYRSPNGRRLSGEALDRFGVELHAIAFDVDCPGTHGTSAPAPDSWRRDLRDRIVRLAEDHPNPYYYETRGGARIVYRQAEPDVLRSPDDARRWAQDYAIATAYMRRRYGIEADPACGDWTRLFRLPHATRDGNTRPENWPVWGTADMQIEALQIEATTEDMEAAELASKAFRTPRLATLEHSASDGYGLLFHLLRARDSIGRWQGDGAYAIRCPNEAQHTSGRTGDGSTLLYLPSSGSEVGAIHCLHAHCSGLTVRDWLAAFSEAERERAREAAGILPRTGAR